MFYLPNSYLCVSFTKYIVLYSSDEICTSLLLSPDQVQPQTCIIFFSNTMYMVYEYLRFSITVTACMGFRTRNSPVCLHKHRHYGKQQVSCHRKH